MNKNLKKEEKKILLHKINALLSVMSRKQLTRIYDFIKCIYIFD